MLLTGLTLFVGPALSKLPHYGLVLLMVASGVVLLVSQPRSLLVNLFLWWTVMTWALYIYAGEKMPWLTLHLLLPGEGDKGEPRFGKARPVLAGGKAIRTGGDAAPVAADWDGDGRLDLVVGAEDGSVVWCRNAGTAREPTAGPTSCRPRS